MRLVLRLPLLAMLSLIISSCMEMGTPVAGPSLNFKRYQPIYMNVSGISVVEDYKSPMRAPNVEHLMPYSPADAVHIWVKDRLRTTGGDKTMQIIIKDARVVDVTPPKEEGFTDWIGMGDDHEYKARLEVELRIYGSGSAMSEANVNVVATRSIVMSPSASVHTRNRMYREMVFDMMTVLNAELEKNIFQHLGQYVNFSMNP